MAYNTSNAAYAYDMQPLSPDYVYGSAAPDYRRAPHRAPEVEKRPRLGVVTGAGREANQAVSPAFVVTVKVFAMLVALFCLVGGARVALATVTSQTLNANAALQSKLDEAAQESSDLEVMRSVYGSSTRIKDVAAGTLGMVEADGGVTIDLSDSGASGSAAGSASTASNAASTGEAASQGTASGSTGSAGAAN